MISLRDHHGEGQPIAHIPQDTASQSRAVADAIANLDRALTSAGHTPGTWALILGDGAVLINEPVVAKTAEAMIAKRWNLLRKLNEAESEDRII
jgi:hypothetical protein